MPEPLKALTVTPCWAHAILHLGKTIENRKWAPSYRGPLLIHSGKNFKVHEFERICEYAEEDGKRLPRRDEILVGGIVGVVDFYKVVEESDNIWFGGPYGWVFRKIRSTPFLPMKGQLKIFNVNPPARWRKDVGL